MTPTIEWPTDEWLDGWKAKHPGSTDTDADCAWWDLQIDKGKPTPYDLTPEQLTEAKKAKKGMIKTVNAYGKETKRERKADPEKRAIIAAIAQALTAEGYDAITINPERQIDFCGYTLTLTKHRPPKG